MLAKRSWNTFWLSVNFSPAVMRVSGQHHGASSITESSAQPERSSLHQLLKPAGRSAPLLSTGTSDVCGRTDTAETQLWSWELERKLPPSHLIVSVLHRGASEIRWRFGSRRAGDVTGHVCSRPVLDIHKQLIMTHNTFPSSHYVLHWIFLILLLLLLRFQNKEPTELVSVSWPNRRKQ